MNPVYIIHREQDPIKMQVHLILSCDITLQEFPLLHSWVINREVYPVCNDQSLSTI